MPILLLAFPSKREKSSTQLLRSLEAYEAHMHDVIATCQRDKRRAGSVDT
jgi:hypothetical protein